MGSGKTSIYLIIFVSFLFLVTGSLTLYLYNIMKDNFFLETSYFLFFIALASLIFAISYLIIQWKLTKSVEGKPIEEPNKESVNKVVESIQEKPNKGSKNIENQKKIKNIKIIKKKKIKRRK